MVRELSHFIDGKRIPGTSGRFAGVFDPNTGGVQALAPLGSISATASLASCDDR